MKLSKQQAAKLVDCVLKDLDARSGFDHWWDSIDEEIQEEVKEELADKLVKESENEDGT